MRATERYGALLLLLLPLGVVHARTWSTSLVEGYQQEWKFLAKFAFAATSESDPGTIRLRAWTFMAGQKVLVYQNEDWFAAVESGACERQASLAFSNSTVEQGAFYGEAKRVIVQRVVQPSPSYVFLALARCASWIDQAQPDSCTGTRPGGGIPDGVFLYFELT